MKVVSSLAAMQRLARGWRTQGVRVVLVPTMGYLHAGHLSLIRRARREASAGGKVVVSVYVNPAQFGPQEDFRKYPRDLKRDRWLCRSEGVNVLFAPGDRQMYPADRGVAYSTFVGEERLSRGMEGASRPTHFRGVTTVVAKLFNLVQPDVAIFGAKDYQQGQVVRKMARDLDFPVRIVVAPTVREADGLALSSRNEYLKTSERSQAVVLWQALCLARRIVRASAKPVSSARLRSELRWLIETRPAATVDYIEFFDARTLEPVARVRRGHRLALAVRVGRTRLIDNGQL